MSEPVRRINDCEGEKEILIFSNAEEMEKWAEKNPNRIILRKERRASQLFSTFRLHVTTP